MKLADFGFTEGINEIIAITENEDGSWNAAPIGIIVENPNSLTAKARLYLNRTRATPLRLTQPPNSERGHGLVRVQI